MPFYPQEDRKQRSIPDFKHHLSLSASLTDLDGMLDVANAHQRLARHPEERCLEGGSPQKSDVPHLPERNISESGKQTLEAKIGQATQALVRARACKSLVYGEVKS